MPYNQIGDLQQLALAEGCTTDNPCVILTLDNILTFMGDVHCTDLAANEVFATLPDGMHPSAHIRVPVIVNGSDLTVLTIAPDGSMRVGAYVTDNYIRLNGVCANVCDSYYNESIGNITPDWTSPLD